MQGLISLRAVMNYIEMHLIETVLRNYGSTKKYVGFVGNLVAFPCKMSYDVGFYGSVSFRAKTKLIQNNIGSLGAKVIFRERLRISGNFVKKLVNSCYSINLNERLL